MLPLIFCWLRRGANAALKRARVAPTNNSALCRHNITNLASSWGRHLKRDLVVWCSTTGSSAATISPVVLIQRATVASLTDSPKVGTIISMAISSALAVPSLYPGHCSNDRFWSITYVFDVAGRSNAVATRSCSRL